MLGSSTSSSKCSSTTLQLLPWRLERITLSRWRTKLLSGQRWRSRTKSLLLCRARQLRRRSRCYKINSKKKMWRRRICKLTLWASFPRIGETIILWTNLNRLLTLHRTCQDINWQNLLKLPPTNYHQPRLRNNSLRWWRRYFNSLRNVSINSTGRGMTRQKSINTSSWINFSFQNGRLTIFKIQKLVYQFHMRSSLFRF